MLTQRIHEHAPVWGRNHHRLNNSSCPTHNHPWHLQPAGVARATADNSSSCLGAPESWVMSSSAGTPNAPPCTRKSATRWQKGEAHVLHNRDTHDVAACSWKTHRALQLPGARPRVRTAHATAATAAMSRRFQHHKSCTLAACPGDASKWQMTKVTTPTHPHTAAPYQPAPTSRLGTAPQQRHTAVGSASEAVQGATLALEGVDDVHSRHRLAPSVLGVGDRVTHHILQEHLCAW